MPLTYASVVQGDSAVSTTSNTVSGTGLGSETLDLRELLAAPGIGQAKYSSVVFQLCIFVRERKLLNFIFVYLSKMYLDIPL